MPAIGKESLPGALELPRWRVLSGPLLRDGRNLGGRRRGVASTNVKQRRIYNKRDKSPDQGTDCAGQRHRQHSLILDAAPCRLKRRSIAVFPLLLKRKFL